MFPQHDKHHVASALNMLVNSFRCVLLLVQLGGDVNICRQEVKLLFLGEYVISASCDGNHVSLLCSQSDVIYRRHAWPGAGFTLDEARPCPTPCVLLVHHSNHCSHDVDSVSANVVHVGSLSRHPGFL